MIRWLRFNAVGVMGSALQVGALWLLVRFGVHYLLATAIAVEAAVLHNYAWHRRWTWAGRTSAGSLGRFHLANGLVSMASNLVLMRAFTGSLGLAPALANVLAIAITSVLNFALSDQWVFSQRRYTPSWRGSPEPGSISRLPSSGATPRLMARPRPLDP